jgi:hypothetical protein
MIGWSNVRPLGGPSGLKSSLILSIPWNSYPIVALWPEKPEEPKRDIRCLLFGKRRRVYRILYEVDEKRKMVWILHIRHGARQDLGPDKLSGLPE